MIRFFVRKFQKKIIKGLLYSFLLQINSGWLDAFSQPTSTDKFSVAAVHFLKEKNQESSSRFKELDTIIAGFQSLRERLETEGCSEEQRIQIYLEFRAFLEELSLLDSKHHASMPSHNEVLNDSVTIKDISNIVCAICSTLKTMQLKHAKKENFADFDDDANILDVAITRASCVQNRIVIILNIVQSIQSELDACCFTLNSKIDHLTIAACDLTAVFTAIQQVDNDVLTVSSKLDACCFTLNSKIDHLSIAACDLSPVFTAINQVDNDVLTVSSKLDACCFTLNSKIDHLTIAATCDFSTVFTAIQQVDNDVLTVSSKLDACCFTLNSKIDHLSISASCDFSTVFTVLQKIDNDVLTVSSQVSNLTNIVNVDFNGTFTSLADIRSEETTIESKLDACCFTLNSKIDALSIAACDLTAVFTAIQQVDNDVLTVSSKLDACCFTLNSKIDHLSISASCDFSTVFTVLQKIDNDVLTVSSQVNNLTNIVNVDFNGTFTSLADIRSEETTIESKLDACCFTLNSKIDHLTIAATCDFSTVFTAIQQVDNDVLTVSSKLDACCFTLNSKIDHLSISASCDFSTVFTVLQKIDNDVLTVSSKLDACCFTLNSKVDALSTLVALDFNGTFTALADIRSEETTIESKLDACCFTLNSKIDRVIAAACDFSTVFTVLQKIDNDVLTVSSKVDNLTNIVNVDFNGTFTSLADIRNEETTIESKLDACCFTLNSKVDNLMLLTFTCAPTPLTVPDTGTTITAPGVYCLTSDVVLSSGSTLGVNASNVVLDLNGHTISGASLTNAINVSGTSDQVIIKNGSIDGAGVGINLASGASNIAVNSIDFLNSGTGFNSLTTSAVSLEDVTANGGFYGFYIINPSDYTINRCSGLNNSNTGFFVQWDGVTTPVGNVAINNCTANNCGREGFHIDSVAGVIIESSTASGNATGFHVQTTNAPSSSKIDVTINNCVGQNNTGTGFFLDNNSGNTNVTLIGVVDNCKAINNSNTGFESTTSSASLVSDSTFKNCIAENNGVGFYIQDVTALVLNACTSTTNSAFGFVIDVVNGAPGNVGFDINDCSSMGNGNAGFLIADHQAANLSIGSVNNSRAINNAADGFFFVAVAGATPQYILQSCIAERNVNGFDSSGVTTAGSCINIGYSSAVSNTGTGFLGSPYTFFYSNYGQCNGTNFDQFSASSAVSGKLDSKIDYLTNLVNLDFNGTFTSLNACCTTINSNIASLSNQIAVDFNGTFTVLSDIRNEEGIIESKIDTCCASIGAQLGTIEAELNLLTSTQINELLNTFTLIAEISLELLATLTQLEQIALNITTTLAQLEFLLDQVIQVENTTQSKLDACCFTLNSKIDIINVQDSLILSKLAIIDTNVDTLLGDFDQTWTILGALNFTLNSRLDIITTDLTTCCSVVGNFTDPSYDCTIFTGSAQIDAAQLTVISWLKTIYRDIRGFANCP